jgi:hypothetical protein
VRFWGETQKLEVNFWYFWAVAQKLNFPTYLRDFVPRLDVLKEKTRTDSYL